MSETQEPELPFYPEPQQDFTTHEAPKLQMVQILNVPYETNHGTMASLMYGVAKDGVVYKYQHTSGGWVALPMIQVYDRYAGKRSKGKNDDPF